MKESGHCCTGDPYQIKDTPVLCLAATFGTAMHCTWVQIFIGSVNVINKSWNVLVLVVVIHRISVAHSALLWLVCVCESNMR